jgi:hypothetical protein
MLGHQECYPFTAQRIRAGVKDVQPETVVATLAIGAAVVKDHGFAQCVLCQPIDLVDIQAVRVIPAALAQAGDGVIHQPLDHLSQGVVELPGGLGMEIERGGGRSL